MKNWRKQIIAAMMVFALAGALVPSGQAVETRGFSDVPDTAWYAEAVNYERYHGGILRAGQRHDPCVHGGGAIPGSEAACGDAY